MTPTRAIVLAAGLGLRMRPLTEHMPKPLVPVAGVPLIDRALDFIRAAGINEVVVNTSYHAELLEAHLAAQGVHISRESVPLETGGGIARALPLLGDAPFAAVNADIICVNKGAHALTRLAAAWDEARMDALLLLHPVERAIGYGGPGDFFLLPEGLKRRGEAVSAPYVFAGVQLIHPRLFDGCPAEPFSLNLLYNRDLSRIHGLVHDGDWLHVGDLEGLALAERYFA